MGWNGLDDLNDLIRRAWDIRRQFHAPVLEIAAPGAKHYENNYFTNNPLSFVNISITENRCECNCTHCRGKLLESMIQVGSPDAMYNLIDHLVEKGCHGILVSGGADRRGEVPLEPFIDAIAYAHRKGLKVLVHTGLVNRSTAARLAEAGVDEVILDIIGDARTIKEVYHIDRQPEDYLDAMLACREEGLALAPHLVIGLYYGQIIGELNALKMIKQADVQVLVLVVLMALAGTPMASVEPPEIEKVTELMALARGMNPHLPISLGCARPSGTYKRILEKRAVDCGVNSMAYPDEETLKYATTRGLKLSFTESCCSLF
jgi:hypothetical protein